MGKTNLQKQIEDARVALKELEREESKVIFKPLLPMGSDLVDKVVEIGARGWSMEYKADCLITPATKDKKAVIEKRVFTVSVKRSKVAVE